MKKSYNKAFTLIELLAVIVILAIILVIAVPKIMDVINSSKKSTLETSAKMIASSAEKIKVQKELLGEEITGEIDCSEFTKITSDYASCKVKFDGNTAMVTISGSGKFQGLSVCNSTKDYAKSLDVEGGCPKYSIKDKTWSEIKLAYESREYEFIIGETKKIELANDLGTHIVRISNTTPCSSVSVKSKTACGLVFEFEDVITKHNMNPSGTYKETQYDLGWNKDGFPASSMFAYLNTEENGIYNLLPEELKSEIIGTTVVSGAGYLDLKEGINYFTTEDVKLYLLAPEEVYTDWQIAGTSFDKSEGTSRQLDYYNFYKEEAMIKSDNGSRTKVIKQYNGENITWWLRTANGGYDDMFLAVGYDGDKSGVGYWARESASDNNGVSPAFRLAE